MDLIKSGSYIDIFYAKTCAITKISTVAGYHIVLATLLFMMSMSCIGVRTDRNYYFFSKIWFYMVILRLRYSLLVLKPLS